MPKAQAKKKKMPAKKAAAKRSVAVKKAAPKLAKAEPVSERGFMWKILKQKQEQRKKLEKQEGGFHNSGPHHRPHENQVGFTRFAGPRRRAA